MYLPSLTSGKAERNDSYKSRFLSMVTPLTVVLLVGLVGAVAENSCRRRCTMTPEPMPAASNSMMDSTADLGLPGVPCENPAMAPPDAGFPTPLANANECGHHLLKCCQVPSPRKKGLNCRRVLSRFRGPQILSTAEYCTAGQVKHFHV